MEAPKSAVTGNSTDQFHDQRDLQSRLSDIAQIPIWIGQLALRYNIPEDLQFAMDLCLEEALSNIIIYGYLREDRPPAHGPLRDPSGDGCFVFEVEDEAPLFNPLEAPELPLWIQTKKCESAAREFACFGGLPTNSRTSRQPEAIFCALSFCKTAKFPADLQSILWTICMD